MTQQEKLALELLQQFTNGKSQSAKQLLTQFSISNDMLQQRLATLQSWGITLVIDQQQLYRLITPPRLSYEALCQYSQDSAIQLFPILPSTNQYLLDHCRNLPSGTACIAEYQTAGRGRLGRRWVANFGHCALFSMLWHWQQPLQTLVGISLALSVAIAEALRQLGISGVTVKWPNDLYLQGKKLGGLLLETSNVTADCPVSLIIGIGINLYTDIQPPPVNHPLISVQEVSEFIDSNQLIGIVLLACRKTLQQFSQQGLNPFLDRWMAYDELRGKWLQLQTPQGAVVTGIARGIDSQGALLVEHQDQLTRWISGSIISYLTPSYT